MDTDLLGSLGKIAGIAGISIGALVLIFRSIIHENFLSKMSQEHSYKITNRIVSFAGLLAVAGLVSWMYLKVSGRDTEKSRLSLKGFVHDLSGNSIQNLKVNIKSGTIYMADGLTDSEGSFNIPVHGNGIVNVLIEITGAGYFPYTKNIDLDFAEKAKDVGEIKVSKQTDEQNTPIVNAPSKASPNSGTSQAGIMKTDESPSANPENFIVINTGEYSMLLSNLGAAAAANLTIGGISYTLSNSNLTVPFSKPGMIDYQITGYTSLMGQTTCTNNSVGKIELSPGARYYLFENLNNSTTTDCNWYLFNESQYLQQKNMLQQRIIDGFRTWGD